MNKEEVIDKLKSAIPYPAMNDYQRVEEEALIYALELVEDIDEPEKPVLTKEEAEWVDNLNESFNLPDALYYITRLGYGYLLNFEMCGKTYELQFDSHATYGEMRKLKERLVNAALYGYEVEKEKLYTVEIPNPNDSVHTILHRTEKGIIISYSPYENYKNIKQNQLTEAEIKQDFEWAWKYAEEVKE